MSSALNDRPLALISLGSNLGDSTCTIHEAIEFLERFSAAPLRQSSLWRSRPIDCPPSSPDFVNAAVLLTPFPSETPEALMEKLQSLEKHFGRRPKTISNEPRPLDLDLIAFGQEVRSTPTLTLPHPRAHLRRFVLAPLSELAPAFLLPGQNKTVAQLDADLAERAEQSITRA